MFGKVKQFIVDKAFGLAFMRYDRNNTGTLDKDQLTSMINDAFQLLKIPRQVSWVETALLLKMFDEDNNDSISKDEAYNAFSTALAKFGGIGGLAKFAGFGKTSTALKDDPNDPYSHIPREEEQVEVKISGYVPPDDIDESMLEKLPPVGQNLKADDLKNVKPEKKEQQSLFHLQENAQTQSQTQNIPQGGPWSGGWQQGGVQQQGAWSQPGGWQQQGQGGQQGAWTPQGQQQASWTQQGAQQQGGWPQQGNWPQQGQGHGNPSHRHGK